jgi:hypothetical protein
LHGSPARIWTSGLKEDYHYGQRHADRKPAVYGDPNQAEEYWVKGTKVDADTYKLVEKWGELLYIDGKVALCRSFVQIPASELQFTAAEIGLLPPSTNPYDMVRLTHSIHRLLKKHNISLSHAKLLAINVVKDNTIAQVVQIHQEVEQSNSDVTRDWILSFAPVPTEVPAPIDFGGPWSDSPVPPVVPLSAKERAWVEMVAEKFARGEISSGSEQSPPTIPPESDDNGDISMDTTSEALRNPCLEAELPEDSPPASTEDNSGMSIWTALAIASGVALTTAKSKSKKMDKVHDKVSA